MYTFFVKKSVFALLFITYLPIIAMENIKEPTIEENKKIIVQIKLTMTREERNKRTKKLATILTLIQEGQSTGDAKKSLNCNKLWKKAKHQILQGADANTIIGFKNSALILAAEHGKKKFAQLLLDNGANVNHLNEFKSTALQ